MLDAEKALAEMTREKKELKSHPQMASVSAGEALVGFNGTYLGGHPALEGQTSANLYIRDDGIRLQLLRRRIDEPWTNITGLAVEGPDEVQTRFTATRLALLGPFALAFKKEKKSAAFIVVEGTFGEFIFQVKTKYPQQLRAQLAPWLERIAPHESALPSVAPSRDRAQQLKDLAALLAQGVGVLTDEEFASEKARILAG